VTREWSSSATERVKLMAKKNIKRIIRPATLEEKKRHAEIRAKVMQEFPAAVDAGLNDSPPGLPAQIRAARETKNLTWYAVAKLAGIPNSSTVRDIEAGRDAQLSNVKAVAQVLGLRLELVEANH
jgi:DNA-binding transcriptional regulator YiaG